MITAIEGPIAWKGSEMDYRTDGMHVLSAAEIAEVDEALRHLRSLGELDFPAITPAAFPLPRFSARLAAFGDALRDGRGFLLLRGLPRERYSTDDMARIYAGIGSHLGRAVPQSWQGELLGHVIDVSDIESDARGYHAGGAQRFHTDTCDIVSLMCVQAAKSGGVSRIASAAAVHNRMLETRPDLLETLYSEYVFRRMEADASHGTGKLVRRVVIFSRQTGKLTCNISGSYPNRAVEFGDAVMTQRQRDALDELERLAASPEFYLDMSIGEGDIQFLNNRALLHGRTHYEDWPEIARRRHLMRLWLYVPDWPDLPANQGMHEPADHPGWLRQRTPFMEVPSRYLATMTQRKAALAA
ncbi:MAG: TauD/TfdA family dioxygenase [Acetobacteraceae bacterium]